MAALPPGSPELFIGFTNLGDAGSYNSRTYRNLPFAVAVLMLLAPAATIYAAAQTPIVTLQRVEVSGTDNQLIITLIADGPISGRLEQASGGATRLFVDLHGVRPRADAVTPVNRGPVLRVRVGLHTAQPPVTRVVLDVAPIPAARIERGEIPGQLRIIIGASNDSATALPPATEADVLRSQRAWCVEVADRLGALIDRHAPSTSQAHMLATMTAWEKFEREVDGHKLAEPLQPVHHALLQSIRLARIAAAHLQRREAEQAAAAIAGARLLLNTARDRLEAMP